MPPRGAKAAGSSEVEGAGGSVKIGSASGLKIRASGAAE